MSVGEIVFIFCFISVVVLFESQTIQRWWCKNKHKEFLKKEVFPWRSMYVVKTYYECKKCGNSWVEIKDYDAL